jgi:hypothetical protein
VVTEESVLWAAATLLSRAFSLQMDHNHDDNDEEEEEEEEDEDEDWDEEEEALMAEEALKEEEEFMKTMQGKKLLPLLKKTNKNHHNCATFTAQLYGRGRSEHHINGFVLVGVR